MTESCMQMSTSEKLGLLPDTNDFKETLSDEYFEVQVSLESLNSTFYSVPPPGSGAILAYILNMLDFYQLKPEDDNPLLFHRIVETFK